MECTCALLRITLTGPLRSHFYLGRNASTNINAPRSEANVYIQDSDDRERTPETPDKRANVSATGYPRTVTTRREKELACPPAFTTELRQGVQLQGQKFVPELP